MKRTLKKGLLYLLGGFVALFLGRFAYGYLSPVERATVLSGTEDFALMTSIGGRSEGLSKVENFASEKLKVQRDANTEAVSVDQKYEKIASVLSTSNDFEDDEKSVRSLASKYSALIQFEQSSGLRGNRRLDLGIGVPPDRFDPMVAELKAIGELSSIRIDKTDKTNEYKDLKARRASLEKTRDALASLKSKGGRIDEFTNLENRILEIDQEIQSTGVKLGDYDQENEFCTVKLSLSEKGATTPPGISIRHRVVDALVWTVQYYVLLLGLLAFGALLTLLLVVILQRLNVIPPPALAVASAD